MFSEGPWIFVGIPNVVKVQYLICFCFRYIVIVQCLYKGRNDDTYLIVGLVILQAWNTQTNTDMSLTGPVGQVYALAVGNDLLFAGTHVCNKRFLFFIYWVEISNIEYIDLLDRIFISQLLFCSAFILLKFVKTQFGAGWKYIGLEI